MVRPPAHVRQDEAREVRVELGQVTLGKAERRIHLARRRADRHALHEQASPSSRAGGVNPVLTHAGVVSCVTALGYDARARPACKPVAARVADPRAERRRSEQQAQALLARFERHPGSSRVRARPCASSRSTRLPCFAQPMRSPYAAQLVQPGVALRRNLCGCGELRRISEQGCDTRRAPRGASALRRPAGGSHGHVTSSSRARVLQHRSWRSDWYSGAFGEAFAIH